MFYGYEYIFRSLYNLKIAIEECIKQYYTQKITTKLKGSTPVQYRINPY
ncbi:IS3 family transposase [Thomasclavelia ramosa]|nr:IS3 family transposase [Thomasclavelia ramosa]MBV4093298.1 IS3 family transposase [Thomasclavelia ramosa]MBV4107584.1 IS3 family transposase [Thomasclavelia ramosa]MBV4110813.1 IS3 family transposase [Thomasclavelia ramosa]MBV4120649.1 IS3 family transposase [Thomasclavelia ramosa]